MKASIVVLFFAGSVSSAVGRTFTVMNACPFTIWPAVFTDLNIGSAVPGIETGWEAAVDTKRAFSVPDDWKAGRIWARHNCDFSRGSGTDTCLDGGCVGGIRCDARLGRGVPPATTTEWILSASDGLDWYDISLVDGFNLPMRITNTAGCPVVGCSGNLESNAGFCDTTAKSCKSSLKADYTLTFCP